MGKWKHFWGKARTFDYSDLRFLYVACLVAIGLVYTAFHVRKHVITYDEMVVIKSLQRIERQRELVNEFQSLIPRLGQPESAALALGVFEQIANTHQHIIDQGSKLAKTCAGLECGRIFDAHLFSPSMTAPEDLPRLQDQIATYLQGLRHAVLVQLQQVDRMNQADVTFDVVAYITLMILLLIQAIYIFRPAIARLNASLATRSELLSRISHEIRNPMNSILGMAEILKGTQLNYEQHQYINNLMRAGNALLEMLNNLIDFSSLENRKVELKAGPLDLFESLDRCISLVSVQAHHKDLAIYLVFDPRIPREVTGDTTRLEQVLINLLNNAVKFTDSGHVVLSVDLVMQNERTVDISFSVLDTGIGIKQEQLGEIFESFVQADSSIQRRYGGSGLGLSISSELIQMMGGELQVQSTYGQGSRFHFTIRLTKVANAQEEALVKLSDFSPIFMVEPSELQTARNNLGAMFPKAQFLTSLPELSQALKDSRQVDQIVVDDHIGIISMIGCRNLAAEHNLADRCLPLIKTNFAKESLDLLKKHGFSRLLMKPLKPWQLLSISQTPTLDATEITPHQQSLPERLSRRHLKVLLVDDSEDNLFLLSEVLSPVAHVIHFATNGLEALEKIKAESYDVVFMDIQMPVMDGYTAIRKIRATEAGDLRSLPVFAVTAHASLVDAQKCREAGFSERIVKPLVRADIYEALSRALSIVDPDDEDSLTHLWPHFFRAREEDLRHLRGALYKRDYSQIGQLGHKIRGSAANFGFAVATRLGSELEKAAEGRNYKRCLDVIDQLEAELSNQN